MQMKIMAIVIRVDFHQDLLRSLQVKGVYCTSRGSLSTSDEIESAAFLKILPCVVPSLVATHLSSHVETAFRHFMKTSPVMEFVLESRPPRILSGGGGLIAFHCHDSNL